MLTTTVLMIVDDRLDPTANVIPVRANDDSTS